MTRSRTTTLDPLAAPQIVQEWLARVRPAIDAELDRRLPAPEEDPGRLCEAMRYAALGSGKRLRPALVLAACEAAGGPADGIDQDALAAAAAVELLHAYTLVHDDLPCMDDDAERRGRPTVHVAFGEATALLAGDGLLTHAFGTLADLGARAGAAVGALAHRTGAHWLLRGQAIDLSGATATTLADVEALHAAKTGALFAAATELGAIAAGAGLDERRRLARYGMALGIAFQHADDRDDGEFTALAAEAAVRMKALCEEATELARGFAAGRTLEAVATWIGARA